jgi:cardiolipin synthase
MHSLLIFALGITFDGSIALWLILAADVLALATVPSVLLSRSGRPLSALSWLLALLAVPVVGVLAWWLLGRTHLARRRLQRRKSADRLYSHREAGASSSGAIDALEEVVPFAGPDVRWTDGVFPVAEADEPILLGSGAEAFAELRAVIAGARREIRLAFYIWHDDEVGGEVCDALIDRARNGVRVRLLLDAVGSSRFLRRRAPALRRAGVDVAAFLPARFRPWAPTFNFRNHRKLVLADGVTAITGGMNIGTVYAMEWRELACRMAGPVVWNLDSVFQEDWYFAAGTEIGPCLEVPLQAERQESSAARHGCCVIASGPDRNVSRMADGIFLALRRARRRVWMLTPYFVPDGGTLAGLRAAALRGVDVRIILPRHNDVPLVRWASRSYYRELLEAGVRIFEYLPTVSHAKALIVDDDLSVVGSSNVDIRSFRLNFELSCFLAAPEFNRQIERVMRSDLEASEEITMSSLPRAASTRLLESAANLLSPLL